MATGMKTKNEQTANVGVMKVTKRDGAGILIEIPEEALANLPLSASGKSRQIFTTGGNKSTGIVVTNKVKESDCDLVVGCNLYVRASDEEAMERKAAVDAAKAKAGN